MSPASARALARLVPLVLSASAFAQDSLRDHLQPITAPVKYGGVYHLGTGTWTRPDAPHPLSYSGAAVIYDNTCIGTYFRGDAHGRRLRRRGPGAIAHESVVRTRLGPGQRLRGRLGERLHDRRLPGRLLRRRPRRRSYQVRFYQTYTACAATPATPTASIPVTGLPGATTAGAQTCWTIDIDLCASSLSFAMNADGDGSYQDGASDLFGWSIQLGSSTALGGDGWIIAGGSFAAGSYQTCSGSDGTIFDTGAFSPIFPANSDPITLGCGTLPAGAGPRGSGMGSLDQFRIESYAGLPDGCYWFGGAPAANLYLQLYTADTTLPTLRPMQSFCAPGTGSSACPCGNPPSGGLARGCNNTAGTGGAFLSAGGDALLAADTLVFTSHNQPPTGLSVLIQSSARTLNPTGFAHGVTCLAGSLRALYVKQAVSGGIVAPGAGDPSVSARSAALGDTISAGTQRFYMVAYRDPVLLGSCIPIATLNSTDAGQVIWR